MKITIDNYEAFLLDKAEGNLTAENARLLEDFFVLHPELRARATEYDLSLQLKPDMSVVYEDTEHLYRKPVIFYRKRYAATAVSIAAMFILAIFVFNINDENTAIPVQKATAETPKAITDLPKAFETQPIAKITKPQRNITKMKEEPAVVKGEDSVVYVDNLVVYEVDNLVEYVEEIDNLVIYGVDNLIEYDTAKNPNFFEQKKQEWNAIAAKGKEAYNFLYAKVTEGKRRFF